MKKPQPKRRYLNTQGRETMHEKKKGGGIIRHRKKNTEKHNWKNEARK